MKNVEGQEIGEVRRDHKAVDHQRRARPQQLVLENRTKGRAVSVLKEVLQPVVNPLLLAMD